MMSAFGISRFTHHVSRLTFHASRLASHVSRLAPHAPRLLLSVLWLTLVACATTPPPSNTRALALSINNPVTLTLWHAQTGASAALLDALANDFHKAYPMITVRVEAKANDGEILRQGLAAIALNRMPDVIIADKRTLAELARRDALMPLDAWLTDAQQGWRDADRADLFPGWLDAGRFPEFQNQTLALPFDQHALVLFYNATGLRAAQLTPPRTWEQFANAARTTTRGATRGWVMAPNAAMFHAFLFSRGSAVLNDAPTRARLDDEPALQTLQLIIALTRSGAAYLADSDEQARADFTQGKAALWFGTSDDIAHVADTFARAQPGAQWGIANIPQNDPARPVIVIGGSALAILRVSEARVRAAWLWARWLTEPEQSARWTQTTLRLPARLSALTLLAPNVPPLFLRLREGLGDTLPTARALPAVKDAARVDAALVELWTSAANGAEPNAALKQAAARINQVLGNIP
jgi:multiple sugar transport system substrate-binding protein